MFEDNAKAIEFAFTKDETKSKNLNIKYLQFREEVKKGTISLYHKRTEDQIIDICRKPLPEASFTKFRERMMQW